MPTTSDTDFQEAIFEAALKGVMEHGYADLSMRKIARRVGCSPGTIYLYYTNKNALYAALVDRAVVRLIESYQPALDIEDPVERLRTFCRCYVRFALTYPELYKVMYLELSVDPREVSPEGYRRAWKPLHDTARALEDADAQGLLRVPSPMDGATLMWAALHGMLSLILARQVSPKADHDRLIGATIEHLISGFQCPEPSSS